MVDNTGDYARSIITNMFNISKYGVAFNLLNKSDEWINKRMDLQSFSPKAMVSFCNKICDQVELVDRYLENDFTIYLTKK